MAEGSYSAYPDYGEWTGWEDWESWDPSNASNDVSFGPNPYYSNYTDSYWQWKPKRPPPQSPQQALPPR